MDQDKDVRGEPDRRHTPRPWLGRRAVRGLLVMLVLGVVLGVGVMWGELRGSNRTSGTKMATTPQGGPAAGDNRGAAMPGMPGMAPGKAQQGGGPSSDEQMVEVSLTPEAAERAGIKTAVVRSGASVSAITVPGTVMSNAYRDTKVNALVGGIVRQVSVELGSPVESGQPLAVIFSIELAEAQMKYLSMRAMLEADHQKLVRTEKLVGLGAASRQELEEVTATHASRATEVAAARQRLLLFGLSPDQVAQLRDASHVVSEVTVHAPGDGVVIARAVNPGQVVPSGQELFMVTDLKTVWVIGDLYEKDFATVRVGSPATVMVTSASDRQLRGRVAYIDPRVDPATRTAKVRIEVPNVSGDLRLGMFVNVSFETGGPRMTLVPRSAVQSIGDRSVVYVPADGEEGRFIERTVKLGRATGDVVEVLAGVKPGERVVTDGSFFLRAEATRTRSGG